jgi:hypothetical protein
MKHGDFKIGERFTCGGKIWRCTDIGTRTIIAIHLDPELERMDRSWFRGPPYAVDETVFDENDFSACEKETS